MKLEEILISPADFDVFVTEQANWLKTRLNDKPTSINPQLVIKTLDDKGDLGLAVCSIMGNFNEDAEKRSVLMGLGRKMHEQRQLPLAIALSCEAWLATNPPKGTEPRHCANKREVLLLAAQSIGNRLIKMVSIPVRRDAQNRMVALEENTPEDDMGSLRFPILEHFFNGFFEASSSRN